VCPLTYAAQANDQKKKKKKKESLLQMAEADFINVKSDEKGHLNAVAMDFADLKPFHVSDWVYAR